MAKKKSKLPSYRLSSSAIHAINKQSKLSEIRNKKREEMKSNIEQQKYDEYRERYNKATESSLLEIENVLSYLLTRNDLYIEKDYSSYNIRLEITNNPNSYCSIHMRIYKESVDLQVDKHNSSNRVNLFNDYLYDKYDTLLEKKYFEYLEDSTKKSYKSYW